MLAEKLIEELQTAIINHDRCRYDRGVDMLGPLEIVIDVFEPIDKTHAFQYKGLSPDISVDLDPVNLQGIVRWVGW